MNEAGRHILHLSVAEHGKLCLLKGDTREALRHFREAIRLCVSAKAPEVFFRHYTQCVLEALEKAGNFGEVVDYCTEAEAHYAGLGLDDAFHRKDRGSIAERLGIARVHLGDRDGAIEALERAVALAGPKVLPLAEDLLAWLRRGYVVSAARVGQLQKTHRYFVIRQDSINPALARALPPDNGSAAPRAVFA
ncbi:MAG: peptidylprolyl isomerase [Pseudomonadota bacterium]